MHNVLLLTDKLVTGGAEMYFCKLENHLKDENMTFYSAAATGEMYNEIHNKANFISLSLKNHLANIKTLSKQVVQKDICIIHANSLRMLLYSIMVKKIIKRDIKLVYTKHNVTILEKMTPFLFKKIVNKHVNQVISVSNFEKENLLRLGVRSDLIQTIYNGVDINQFSFQPLQSRKIFNVGILARLSKEKNHTLFLNIANELRDMEQIIFQIAGDGPERTSIEKEIGKLQLHDKVNVLGQVSNPYKFMCNMDLLVLTSFREVFPMVVLEAMATGTPIVTIDVGGVKEAIVDYETGILIPRHSEKEFSETIKFLHANEDLRQGLRYAARKKVEETFTLSAMIHATLESYRC